jgi:hypothetical protein
MEQLTINKFQDLPAELQQQVLDYIEFLLGKYQLKKKQERNGQKNSQPEMPERLKIAMQYKGDALFPDAPISKYDWYEQ